MGKTSRKVKKVFEKLVEIYKISVGGRKGEKNGD